MKIELTKEKKDQIGSRTAQITFGLICGRIEEEFKNKDVLIITKEEWEKNRDTLLQESCDIAVNELMEEWITS
jgi:hypothetical protein